MNKHLQNNNLNNKNKKLLVILAGGTGGHIFSGLAVANYISSMYDWNVHWIGTSNHMEASIVPKYGISISFIKIKALKGKKLIKKLKLPYYVISSFLKSRRIIRNFKPSVVLGMGGYISGPSGLAAWSLGIPMILHEQNCVAGLTNKILSKFANKVLQAIPGTFPNAEVVGNPLRSNLLNVPEPKKRFLNRIGPIRILVIGGSQGARIFNTIMPIVAHRMSGTISIWHQVGKGLLNEISLAYSIFGETNHNIVEFINDIDIAYSWADIIISRAGALTVSEISAIGLPALLVPFIHTDRQQFLNAKLLENIGSAIIVEERDFTVEKVISLLNSLNRNLLLDMACRARKISIINATEKITKEIIKMSK